MTTSLPHTHIRLRDLSELVAGIPYVIGFPPTDSLVLFTFRRCPELKLSTTIRVDLPKSEHFPLVAAELANAVALNEAVAVIAVAIGEDAAHHGQLIASLREALSDKGILLSHASWVDKVAHGEQWQCYDDPLCTGIVPDPQSSALAAACAVAGDTTYPSREAVAAHLAPDPEETLAIRRKLLDAYRPSSEQVYLEADRAADLELLGMALDLAMTSYDPPALTDDQVARLGVALSQIPVKDECLAIALSDEREPAERLWTVLVRALPAPERAEPAFFLAMSAYLRGSGVLAALALSIVMEADPLHSTGVLLDFALRMGIPPDQLRSLLMTSIVKNDEKDADPAAVEDDDPPWDTTTEQPLLTPMADSTTPEPPSSEEEGTEAIGEPGHTTWPPHRRPDTEPANGSGSPPASPPAITATISLAHGRSTASWMRSAAPKVRASGGHVRPPVSGTAPMPATAGGAVPVGRSLVDGPAPWEVSGAPSPTDLVIGGSGHAAAGSAPATEDGPRSGAAAHIARPAESAVRRGPGHLCR
ncbi:DUF4192 family protein [Actinophytocola sp.]|uniref:DUF4192 domain-containing protein n=1 Tax=Actinophytocola sp. TaxID=1872138 RepID=UPI003899E6EB